MPLWQLRLTTQSQLELGREALQQALQLCKGHKPLVVLHPLFAAIAVEIKLEAI